MRYRIKSKEIIGFVFAVLLFCLLVNFLSGDLAKSVPVQNKENQALHELDDIKALLEDGSYADARALAQEILDEVEDKYGIDSLQTAQVLDVLVEANIGMDKQVDDESQALLERAKTIRERVLGPGHPEVLHCLVNYSRLYQKAGDYDNAKELSDRALSKADKTFGPNHIETAAIMRSHGALLHKIQDYVEDLSS